MMMPIIWFCFPTHFPENSRKSSLYVLDICRGVGRIFENARTCCYPPYCVEPFIFMPKKFLPTWFQIWIQGLEPFLFLNWNTNLTQLLALLYLSIYHSIYFISSGISTSIASAPSYAQRWINFSILAWAVSTSVELKDQSAQNSRNEEFMVSTAGLGDCWSDRQSKWTRLSTACIIDFKLWSWFTSNPLS